MKYSQFNSLIRVSEKSDILYNALTHLFVVLPHGLVPATPEELDEPIISTYTKHGFIVPKELDETSGIFEQYRQTSDNNSDFILTINPTLECNFRCWYCYETHAKNMVMSEKVKIKVYKLIANLIRKYPLLTLSFFGGEPMLEFDSTIKPIMEWASQEAKKHNHLIRYTFTTNGFLINEDIADFLKNYPCNAFQITLDGNKESHNRTRVANDADSFLTIINNIKLLCQKGLHVLLRLNLTIANVDGAFDIPDYFKNFTPEEKNHLKVTCEQVWQDIENGSIYDKVICLRKRFKDIGILHEAKNLDSIQHCCYGDKKNSAVVNYDGRVFKCTAIDFNNHDPEGYISEEGDLCFSQDSYKTMLERRRDKMKNFKCASCRILPLCNGGCFRKIMSKNGHSCLFPTDEEKNKMILENIEEIIYAKQ